MNLVLASLTSILIFMNTAGLSHLARAPILDPVTDSHELVGRWGGLGESLWPIGVSGWEGERGLILANISEPSCGTVCWRSWFARRGLLDYMAQTWWQTMNTKGFLTSGGRVNSYTIIRGGM